ncbi:MAG: phosphoglycerate mutase family protein [Sneathiella sp.]|uniref:phosphoglycerate mutase family protein n=1 Tax=Sneathiella sp. TaxID=1964365 RepID=UPI00300115CD
MKTVEVRRHTMRQKPNAHLSSEGIELANFAGARMGNYDRVFTSSLPRSIETAIAMGYEVTECIEKLGSIPEEILAKLNWPNTLQAISQVIKTNYDCFQFARQQASIWFDCIKDLPDESRVLIISHGGIIELGALGSTELDEHCAPRSAFGYCEGFCLEYRDAECVNFDLQLMPEKRRLISNK